MRCVLTRFVGLSLLALGGCVSFDTEPNDRDSAAIESAGALPPRDAVRPAAPSLDGDTYIASDGAKLPLRSFLPEGKPAVIVLALHGFDDYSNAFTLPAPDLVRHGIAVYAYDQRGFGAAPHRGRWAGGELMVDDAARAARLLRERYPQTPIYLLGESMGGAVAIIAATAPDPLPIDGVILSAPAVWGRQTMNIFERAGLWLADLLPAMRFSHRSLPIKVRPSDNIPMLRALGADPLVIKETRSDALNGLVDLMGAALTAAPRLTVPTLVLYGAKDEVVPRPPVSLLVKNLPATSRPRQRVALYANGYHMLLRDLEARVVIDDIALWMLHPADPLPSHADQGARAALTGQGEILAAQ